MSDDEQQERYIDPNSGAAPQPGGFAVSVVETGKESPKQTNPPKDATYEAAQEHSAAPAGSQPGNPDGENASEAGTTESEDGGGNEAEVSAGASNDEGPTTTDESQGSADEADDQAGEEKDYSDVLAKKMPEVQRYMDQHPDEKAAIKAAEAQRDRPRQGVMEH